MSQSFSFHRWSLARRRGCPGTRCARPVRDLPGSIPTEAREPLDIYGVRSGYRICSSHLVDGLSCRTALAGISGDRSELRRDGAGMRLASKIFLTAALVIVVLAGVGFLSLGAVSRLVSVNRDIATRTVPAVRLTASAREAIPALVRLEARAVVLGDASFASAGTERAARGAQDLDGRAAYAESEQETLHLRRARAAFAGYSRIVAHDQALLKRGDRARAVGLSETDARTRITELQENLEGLMAATYARSLGAQAEAARLETRTWTAVLVALGTAVGLALLATAIIARRITRSLARLAAATAEVETGAFRGLLVGDGHDEISALTRSFNRMTTQLDRQFSALSMRSAISITLNQHEKLEDILQRCTEILARHLDLALAGVWTPDGGAKVLELKASARSCTHPSETLRRVALGLGAIGLLAAECQTLLARAILQDPRMGDPAWARGEGLVAFVGHPLLVEDRLVGVPAPFARAPLDGLAPAGLPSAAV